MKIVRLSAAFALLIAGTVSLIGCIWLPGTYQRSGGGPRPESRIGKADSDRPLRLTRSTRDDVERVLGMPAAASDDGLAVVYAYDVDVAYWMLCFVIPAPVRESRFLRLQFAADGRLRSYEVFKDPDGPKSPLFTPAGPSPEKVRKWLTAPTSSSN